MIVPHDRLAADTLQALLEEFVTRDGTDYGQQEIGLEQKVSQVRQQLRRGEVVIFYDLTSEAITVLTREDARRFEQQSYQQQPDEQLSYPQQQSYEYQDQDIEPYPYDD